MCIIKDGGQIVNDIDLLIVQDDEGTCIGPGILYYYKEMLACLPINMTTQLRMINKAQTLVCGIISDSQSNTQVFDLSNFVN